LWLRRLPTTPGAALAGFGLNRQIKIQGQIKSEVAWQVWIKSVARCAGGAIPC